MPLGAKLCHQKLNKFNRIGGCSTLLPRKVEFCWVAFIVRWKICNKITRTCVVMSLTLWNGIHWTTLLTAATIGRLPSRILPRHRYFEALYSNHLENFGRHLSSLVLIVSEATNIDDWTAWIGVNLLSRYLQDCTEISSRRISRGLFVIPMSPDAFWIGTVCQQSSWFL